MMGIQHDWAAARHTRRSPRSKKGVNTIEQLVDAEPNVTLFQRLHGEILGNLSFVLRQAGQPVPLRSTLNAIIVRDHQPSLVEANPADGHAPPPAWGGSFNNIGDLELPPAIGWLTPS